MSDQKDWIVNPMSAVASVATMAETTKKLEGKYATIFKTKRERARELIAEHAGIALGTVENLLRKPPRLKVIPEGLRPTLDSLLIRALETEIARATHELQTARQHSHRPDTPEIFAAEAALAHAFDAIQKIPR